MEALVIILIYIVGVFAAIMLSTYLWADELDDDDEEVAVFFCMLSWLFVVAVLLMTYVINYLFVWFYNKCKEKFRKI